MDTLETLIRDTLRDHASDAPTAVAVPGPRTRHRLAAGLAAVLVAALAVTVAMLRGGTHRSEPAVPAGYRPISYHGITLAVPEHLSVVFSECGSPHDTVIASDGGFSTCPVVLGAPARPVGTLVWLGSSDWGSDYDALSTHPVVVDGVAARRGAGRLSPDLSSDPSATLRIPGLDVVIGVTAPDRRVIDTVLNSVRVTPIDRLGCAATMPAITESAPAGPPSSAAICAYSADKQLFASGAATGHDIGWLLAAADGVDEAPGDLVFLARFGYDDGRSWFVRVGDSRRVAALVR